MLVSGPIKNQFALTTASMKSTKATEHKGLFRLAPTTTTTTKQTKHNDDDDDDNDNDPTK